MNYFGKFDASVSDALGQHPSAHLFSESVHATHVPADAVVVSDAQLLFNAEFKRSGVDLVLSGEGREVVLHDYFKGPTRASIASPDGAHLTGDIVTALAGEVQLAQADGSAGAHVVIGHVTKLVGSATAVRNGVSIILNNGDNVEKGDVVASGSDSTVGITFIDGTVFGLSSNARMVLNEMVYDPNGSNNSSLLSLVAGTITFVAGETAKHGDMKVDTPVATMGIRGTAVLVEIDFTVPGQTPDAKFQVLVEPDGTTGSYILFDKQTLTPLALVDTAGHQININNGLLSETLTPLSPEIQKLIQDVFTLKFSDNSNTKSFDHFTDVVIQLPLQPSQFPIGSSVAPFIPVTLNFNGNAANGNSATPPIIIPHLPGQLSIHANSGVLVERPNATGPSQDTISGTITFKDGNVTDTPTLSVTFSSFTYQDAKGNNLTLSAQQLQTLETALSLSANPGNGNNGWTYSIPASALSSLAVGSTLTLNYNATVNNNFGPDDETATAPFSITIKIAGEIWSETNEVASPAPGDWATGANWETGVAPTSADDVIIVTDPQKTGTPFYAVTINSAAFADSVTMNNLTGISPDEDTNKPELDNNNSLTIGSGGLHLNADSILRNFGTLSIGGIAEILQNSLLENSGLLTLAQGGDFRDSSSIINSGTIELVHGTLNVEVDVANADGKLKVDDSATLKLANGAVITQGEITLGASSVLDVESAGGATLDGVTVIGTGGESPSVVEIGVTTAGGSILTMEDGASITNGFMTIGADSRLDVIAGGATLDGVAATSLGTIEIGVNTEEGGSILTLKDGTSVVGGSMTIAAESVLDIESALGATLDGVTVTGTSGDPPSTIEIGVEAEGGSTLVIADGTSITNGNMTIAASSTLDVESTLGATLDGVTVTGTSGADEGEPSTIEIGVNTISGSILVLLDGTSITYGDITIAANSTLDIESAGGATLNDVTVTNAGTIQVDGGEGPTVTLVLDGGTTIAGGSLLIHDPSSPDEGVVEIKTGGATFDDVTVTNNNELIIDATVTLTLTDNTSILGGTIDDAGTLLVSSASEIHNATVNGGGDVTVADGVTLTLSGVTLDDVTLSGRFENSDALTLNGVTLDGATLSGGTDAATAVTVSADSEIDSATVTGDIAVDPDVTLTLSEVTLDGVTLSGGTDVADAVTVSADSEIDSATVTGDITVDPDVMLTLSEVTLDGVTLSGGTDAADAVTVSADSEIDNATLTGDITVDPDVTLTLNTVTLDGVTLSGGTDAATAVTVDADSEIDNATVTGDITVDSDVTLTLNAVTLDGATLNGGTIADTGTLSVTASSEIENATVNGGGSITVASGKTLTLATDTLDNVTLAGSFSDVGTVTIDETVTLNGATLNGGTIADTGTLSVTASSEIENATVNGGGSITVASGKTLTLDTDTLDNVTLAGSFSDVGTVTIDETVTLNGATLNGGTIADTGTLSVTASSEIENATVNGGGSITVASGKTLTLDTDTLDDVTLSGSFSDVGTVTIDEMVTLNGATLNGGTIADTGTLSVTASSEIENATVNGGGSITVASGKTLTLATDTLDNVTLSGSFSDVGTVTIDETVTLNGATLNGGTIADIGTLSVTASSEIENATVNGGGSITVASGKTLTLATDTLDNVTLSGSFSDVGTVTIDETVTLNGATLNGGTLDISGTLDSIGTSFITGAIIVNSNQIDVVSGMLTIDPAPFTNDGTVTVDNNATLVLSGENVDNASGTFETTGSGLINLLNTTINNGKLAGTIDTAAGNKSSTLNGVTLGLGTLVTALVGVLELTGSITNHGEVDANGGSVDLLGATITGGTLGGPGTIVTASGNVNSILNGVTIAGGSTVTVSAGELDLAGTIANGGEFDVTSKLFFDDATVVGGTLAGSGQISTGSANHLSILENVTVAAGSKVSSTSGVLELTGTIANHGEIDATGNGATGVVKLYSATVDGGILGGGGTFETASPLNTLDGVTITAGTTVAVIDATTLDLVGTIADKGTIALGSSGHATQLEISGSVSLTGGGNVTMSDNSHNFIVSDGHDATLTNSDTISGAGTIGDSHLTLINNGTIDATGTHPLIINTSVTNNSTGVLEASAGHALQIDGNVVNDGTIEAGSYAHVTITGNITNTTSSTTGAIDISDHATVEIGGAVSSGQTVAFEQSNGDGLLILDDSHDFAGTIAGLVEADPETAENQVDLVDLAWHDTSFDGLRFQRMHVSFDAKDSEVTVSYQVNFQTIDSVTLKVSGISTGEFEIHSDGHGGTLLDDPSSTGTNTIDSGDVLGISAASSATINFTNTSGTTGELLLMDSKDFTGTIAGFAGDGTIANSDLIDLADLNFANVATDKTTYTENANGTGTLTLYDASGQALDSLNFSGNYQLANFTIENDGSGGTLIVDPPVSTSSPTPSNTVVASGPNQVLSGSAPADNFVFNFAAVGHSTIANFNPAADAIQFSSSVFANVQSILNAVHDDGHGNSVIAIDAHDSITLNGVNKAQLHANDFHVV